MWKSEREKVSTIWLEEKKKSSNKLYSRIKFDIKSSHNVDNRFNFQLFLVDTTNPHHWFRNWSFGRWWIVLISTIHVEENHNLMIRVFFFTNCEARIELIQVNSFASCYDTRRQNTSWILLCEFHIDYQLTRFYHRIHYRKREKSTWSILFFL